MTGKSSRLTRCATVALLLLAALPSGCIFTNHFPARASRTETMGYSLVPGGQLDLTTFNGGIEVRKYEKPGVWLERTTTCRAATDLEAREGLDLLSPEVVTSERMLSVQVRDPRSSHHRFQVDFIALVPERSRLFLNTSNGKISVEGIQGEIVAHTSNGSVAVRDSGLKKVHLVTSNGSILAERLAGDLEARTSNGKVEIHNCPGKIEATTSNSDLEIDCGGQEVTRDIVAETSNGSVSCVLPVSFSGEVEVRTSNASIHCDFPVTIDAGEIGKHHLKGKIGGAGGPGVHLWTSNGGVHIQRGHDPRE